MARVGRSAILICLAAVLDGLSAAPGRTHIYPAPMPLSALSFARDHNGLIWIAAMEGVFRFDGLHFHAIPGYPFRDARFVAAEPGGAVWAGGPQGLARYENSVWKALLLDPVEAMALGPAGLWVNAGGLRLISAGNAERRFAGTIPTGELLVDGKGALWFPCGENVCTMRPPHWRLESQRNPARGKWQKLIPERDGQGYWMSTASEVALVDAGQVRSRQEAPHPGITSQFSAAPRPR